MLQEATLRRDQFREGTSIELADGGSWVFPAPGVPVAALADSTSLRREPRYLELLHDLDDADSNADRHRGELALAIYLLSRNYQLDPPRFRDLLSYKVNDSRRQVLQRDLAELAAEHLRNLGPATFPTSTNTATQRVPADEHPLRPGYLVQGWWHRLRHVGYSERTA